MKIYRKLLMLILVLSALLSLSACSGEYIDPSSSGGGKKDDPSEEYTPPEMNDDPTDDFTVTLYADGQPYSPRMEMYAYWSDGYSIHTAKFDGEGIARTDGLDGDYKVTLSAVPNEYTYDPNSNIATNDDRNIVLELHTLHILTGSGTGSMTGHPISQTGVYAATLDGPDSAIYFMYSPSENGVYTIESWVDTEADNVNPYMDVYIGSFAWNQYQRTIDDGGRAGSYTVNFVHTVKLTEDQVGNNYIFAVKADSKNNKYPVTVTFAIKRDGGFEYPEGSTRVNGGLAVPTHDFSDFNKAEHEYDDSEYQIAYPEYKFEGMNNTYVFDERRFKVWERSDGGDGFYHLYDTEKYPDTDGYGPILYAFITENTRFIERPFYRIEYKGDSNESLNSALTAGGYNYKALIEGYSHLSTLGSVNDGGYFCVTECVCHNTSTELGWACVAKRDEDGNLIKCADCNKDCRPCPEELFDYATLYINGTEITDPLTASLKIEKCNAVGFTYMGVYYTLTLKEKGEEDTALLAAKYTAACDDSSFELSVTDTEISFTVGAEKITLTYVQGFRGYQHYCNSDGLVPVTEELRDFLYAYCMKETFFYDGTGRYEDVLISGKYFQAVDESGWLFACAYYEKK